MSARAPAADGLGADHGMLGMFGEHEGFDVSAGSGNGLLNILTVGLMKFVFLAAKYRNFMFCRSSKFLLLWNAECVKTKKKTSRILWIVNSSQQQH